MATSLELNNNAINKNDKYTALSDDKLLVLIGNERDRKALTELYKRYKHALVSFLRRGMYETKLIEEIYNDVMLTVWQKASSFRGDSKVSTWIFAIAYRVRMTHTRKESRHNHISTDELNYDLAPDDDAGLNETVRSAMLELSDQHSSVIELAYFHGYSMVEIAAIVDCPPNTVKTRLFHARQNLKAIIQANQSNAGTGL